MLDSVTCVTLMGGITLVLVVTSFFFVFDWILHKQIVSGGAAGRYVLITGCDSGFGRRAAQRLDEAGCHVIATCLTPEGISAVRDMCSSRLTAVEMDVTDETSVHHAFVVVTELLQPDKALWGIVNNVGVPGLIGPLEWMTQANITQLFEVNVFGMCRVVRTFLPLVKRCSGSRIINMSSILGRLNIPFAAPYCMTKCAIESFSDALRVELHPYYIHVSVIEPGAHATNFMDSIKNCVTAAWDHLPTDTKDKFGTDYLQKVIFLGTRLIPFFGSANINAVVDAYCHALFAVRPRRRYVVGFDAKLMQFMSLLPSCILDFLFLSPVLRAVPAACRH